MDVSRAICAAIAIATVLQANPLRQVSAQKKRPSVLAVRSAPDTLFRKMFSRWITSLWVAPSQILSRRQYLARPILRFHETLRVGSATGSLVATYEHQEFRFDPFEIRAGVRPSERAGLRVSPVPEVRYRYLRIGVAIRAPLFHAFMAELSMTSAFIFSVGSRLADKASIPLWHAVDLSLAVSLSYAISTTSELWGAAFFQEAWWSTSAPLDLSVADIAFKRSLVGSAGIRWKVD